MTDDQPAELTAVMPNVQRLLAAQGVAFSSAFATTSLCCPARTTVLRGQYVHNHTVLSNGGPQGGFPKFYQTGFEASTLATWLQDKGYETALMGKYLNSYPFGPPDRQSAQLPRAAAELRPAGLERVVRVFRRT